MPRTTLNLEDNLLRRLKERAAREDRTLHSVIDELLRRGLAVETDPDYRLRIRTWKAEIQPGVNLFDRDTLFGGMSRWTKGRSR